MNELRAPKRRLNIPRPNQPKTPTRHKTSSAPKIITTLGVIAASTFISGCCATTPPHATLAPPKALAQASPPRINRINDPGTIAALQKAGISPDAIHCNNRVVWLPQLHILAKRAAAEIARTTLAAPSSVDKAQEKKNTRTILGYFVRLIFEHIGTQNVGAMRLRGMSYTDAQGKSHPLVVFRSGVTTDAAKPGSCFRTLLGAGHVRNVVNLYGGHFPFFDFIRTEKEVAQELGASHVNVATSGVEWRKALKTKEGYEKNKAAAAKQVATLIRDRLLRPDGHAPKGNLYLHCGGGMHRSGMVYGILQRCINHAPMTLVESEYKRHTAYQSPEHPGGFETLNLRFIREFDCTLLTPALQKTQPPKAR